MKRTGFKLTPYLFLAPHLLFFVVFLVVPTIMGVWISLHNWDYLTPAKFVGLDNYAKLFTPGTIDNKDFTLGLKNTIIFVVCSVPINVLFSLVLATMLNQLKRSRNALGLIFYCPVVLSISCVCTTWRFFADSQIGIINRYLGYLFHIEPIPWLTKQPYVWMILVMTTVWWTIGRNILYYLAGLTDISPHLYESASLDGANGIQQFFYITIPNIMRTLLFVAVIETIAQFNIFGQPYIMTNGEGWPNKSTKVILMFIREVAFREFRMGMATAMSILLGLVIIIFTIFQFKLFINPADK